MGTKVQPWVWLHVGKAHRLTPHIICLRLTNSQTHCYEPPLKLLTRQEHLDYIDYGVGLDYIDYGVDLDHIDYGVVRAVTWMPRYAHSLQLEPCQKQLGSASAGLGWARGALGLMLH